MKYLALHINGRRRRVITAGSLQAAKRKLPYRGQDYLVEPMVLNEVKTRAEQKTQG